MGTATSAFGVPQRWDRAFFLAQIYLGGDAIVLAAVLYDSVTRSSVHPVYLAAVPWILSVQALTSWIYHAPGWLPIARGTPVA